MKIVHLCLGNFYIDDYSYQENLLPKFHKKLGYDVEIISSLMTFDKSGNMDFLSEVTSYISKDGIKVTRIPYRKPFFLNRKLKKYIGALDVLSKSEPDILFIHGCQFLDMKEIVKYLKEHSSVRVYVDNHADFNNSAQNWLSKNILHRILWRYTAHLVLPYTTKFYGVLPQRVEFLINEYKLPQSKCELLNMGADDDYVNMYSSTKAINDIKTELNISLDKFVIVSGGKIDHNKPEMLNLMRAVKNLADEKVNLYVFGTVANELKEEFESLIDDKYVHFLGWADVNLSYKYFSMADLICFPGLHSVYWEQVVAMKKPLVCKYIKGVQHIDLGNNIKYLYKSDEVEILNVIKDLLDNNREEYKKMIDSIEKTDTNRFLYSEIAKNSIKE